MNSFQHICVLTHPPAVLFGAIFTIVFESIVLALTWNRTVDIRTTLRKRKINTGLTALLWRDGA